MGDGPAQSTEEEPFAPQITEAEKKEVESRAPIRAAVVYETVRREGEEELARHWRALAWSGLAAGLSMGFSLVTEGLLRSELPDAPWITIITKTGYTIGFLIVVLGRQQLFTENTVTAILPLLSRRDLSTLLKALRLWLVVLITNLLGATAFSWVIGNSTIFPPEVRQAFEQIGRQAMGGDFYTILLRGIFAGWLIALMVWLLPAAEAGRLWVILIITYVVGLAGLTHIIAGSVEVTYLANTGLISWGQYLAGYMTPTLVGNIVGGVALVAVLGHVQVVAGGTANENHKQRSKSGQSSKR